MVTRAENQSNIVVVEDLESQRDSCVVVDWGNEETKRGRERKRRNGREREKVCVWSFERDIVYFLIQRERERERERERP